LNRSSKFAAALFAVAITLTAADRYEASEPHMGTLVSITLYADTEDQAQQAFRAAFARIAELNRILSDYDPQSELSRICQLDAPLSPDLLTVVQHAQKLAAETHGAFDITVGPLSRLWRTARREKRLPSPAEMEEARSRSGYRNFKIQDGRAHCAIPGMQLDAGGIGKGYAADQALLAMKKLGVTQALVAVSGDVAAGDAPPGKAGWKVKIPGETIDLTNAAVSTSGDEFQFVEIDGVRYSHLFDPRTGMALTNSRTVSIIARSGIEADALTKAAAVSDSRTVARFLQSHQVRVLVK
jgi:thiamine biosynthesis lipoprotein